MGMQTAPAQLFYDFCLDDHIPEDHLLRRIDRFLDLEKVRTELRPFYSSIGRPSIDPELMKGALPMQASFNKPRNNLPVAFSTALSSPPPPPPPRPSQGGF